MWLSRRITLPEAAEEAASLGTVTIGGANAAVVNDAEKRSARVLGPGGYLWQPSRDDSVLVVRGNELYVTGKLEENSGIEPGEVKIFSQGASVHIKNDGTIEIKGKVDVVGELRENGRRVLTE